MLTILFAERKQYSMNNFKERPKHGNNIKIYLLGSNVRIFLFTVFSLLSTSLSAQTDLRFEQITIEGGLSQNYVEAIYQDKEGFVWFGTHDGLNRYDGYSIKVFTSKATDTTAISDNYIRSIIEDSKGYLWIGTSFGGLNKFNRVTGNFIKYKNNPDDPNSLSHNNVKAIYEDTSGMIWIGTEGGGLNRLNPETGKIQRFLKSMGESGGLPAKYVSTISADEEGNLWFATDAGLAHFNFSTEHFTLIPFFSVYGAEDEFVEWRLFIDSDNILWVATNILYRINPADRSRLLTLSQSEAGKLLEQLRIGDLHNGSIYAINEDGKKDLWIGMSPGLAVFDKKSGRITHYDHNTQNQFDVKGSISAIFRSRSGLMWLGSNGHGVSKLSRSFQRFTSIQHNPFKANSLQSRSIRGIYEDRDGMLWLSGYNGLDKFDRSANKFTHYSSNPKSSKDIFPSVVWIIYEDPLGGGDILWFGAEGRGLSRFNRKTNDIIYYENLPGNVNSLSWNFVKSIYRDRSDQLWIGTYRGLNRFDEINQKFKRYLYDSDDKYSKDSFNINAIYQTETLSSLWVATDNGLIYFDPTTEHFIQFINDPKNPNGISHNGVNCMYQDKAGRFWIGTIGGLNRIDLTQFVDGEMPDPKNITFSHFTEEDGLPNNFIYGILEDEEGMLWLSTNKGISKFNPENNSFRNYDVSDGLQSNEFNRNAYHKSRDGEMFFGGINGINSFYPRLLEDNFHIPPVVITDFKIFNESVPYDRYITLRNVDESSMPEHKTEIDEIRLSYEDKVFSIEYAALDYTVPEKNQYSYKMEGFDKKWVQAGSKREVTYTNLSPGKYTFRVKGSNNDGIWNEEGKSLRIIITPPFWQTWWFRILSFITVIASVFTLFRFRTKSIKARNRALQKEIDEHKETEKKRLDLQGKLKQAERMESLGLLAGGVAHDLNNIIGPIMAYPELIKINLAEGRSVDKKLDAISASSRRAADVISDLLALTRRGKYKMDTIDLNDFITEYIESPEGIAIFKMNPKITAEIHLSEDKLLITGSKAHIPKIIMNLVNNACESMPEGGTLTLSSSSIKVINEELSDKNIPQGKYNVLTIEDQGEGIPSENIVKIFDPFFTTKMKSGKSGTGLGLSVVYNVLKDHDAHIDVESKTGVGTKFSIYFPQNREGVQTPSEPKVDNRGSEKILVVDDWEEQREIASILLEELGYEVDSVESGQDAIEYLMKKNVDLVWLDMILGNEMDGLDTYIEIIKIKPGQKTIIVSGYSRSDRVKEAERLGVNGFMQKPYDLDDIMITLHSVL